MSTIVKSISKIVLPFTFDKFDYKETSILSLNYKDKEYQIWIPFNINPQHLFNNVSEKIGDFDNCIGNSYRLNHNIRSLFGLPKNSNTKINLISRNNMDNQKFTIENIYIHMFETGIGFLEFEINYETTSYKTFLDMNYFLSEFKSKANLINYEVKISKDEVNIIKTSLLEVSNKLLRVFPNISDFENQNLLLSSNKPLIFSALTLEKKPENIQEMLFNSMNNYKDSYKSPLDTENIFSPFENSFWGASPNGVVNISHLIDDETTNNFFTTGFYANFRKQYFFLFLLTLNQRFTLIKRISEIDQVERNKNETELSVINAKKQVDLMIEESSLYHIRSNFNVVSSIVQINKTYNLMKNVFSIDELAIELDNKLKGLTYLSNCYYQQYTNILNKKEELRKTIVEIKKTNINMIVYIVTQIIGSLSIFMLVFNFTETLTGETITINNSWIYLPSIISILFFGIILFQSINMILSKKELIHRLKNLKKEII